MLVATITPAMLTASTDADLDHSLTRLYDMHLTVYGEAQEAVHVEIMAVLGEISARLDAWLTTHAG